MQHTEHTRLIALLDEQHEWPSLYAFKFVVPEEHAHHLKEAIPGAEKVEVRPSSGGKYAAYTFHCPVGSGQEVLDVYSRVRDRGIKGLISL